MLSHNGRFVVYVSPFSWLNERLKTLSRAVMKIAERLGADVEFALF